MKAIDYVIVNILLKICDILTSYSEKITKVDIHTIRSLLREKLAGLELEAIKRGLNINE
jgi:hypothetical protein